jgi:predicted transcriptional regulator YdeE
MNTRTLLGFHVAGYAVRTSNSDIAKISNVWSNFLQADLASLVPIRIGQEIYAVYFDYENDHTGSYTFLLGVKVPSSEAIAPGTSGVEIQAGDYAVVTTAKGPAHEVVPAAWLQIWNNKELESARAYKADFEVYGDKAADPNDAQVEIYLSRPYY